MALEKFKIEVIKTDEFEVEVDSDIWNEEMRIQFGKSFWDLDDTADVAKSLADSVSRKGLEEFYEGFGIVKTLYSDGSVRKQWYTDEKGKLKFRTDDDYTKGITIRVISMDDDVEANLID